MDMLCLCFQIMQDLIKKAENHIKKILRMTLTRFHRLIVIEPHRAISISYSRLQLKMEAAHSFVEHTHLDSKVHDRKATDILMLLYQKKTAHQYGHTICHPYGVIFISFIFTFFLNPLYNKT